VRSARLRVAALLVALAVTAAWAYGRLSARSERNRWERTLGVVVYALGAAEPGAVDQLRGNLARLGARLAEDRAALGPGPAPFRFDVVGPLAPGRLPPADPPPGASWLARAGYAAELWRAERAVREVAPEPDPRAYDVRVYLVLSPGTERSFAEGVAAAGGEVAVVHAALARDALLAATAVVHETLHAVGATDKYDPAGHAVAPAGLYQPAREPPYPQARAELMVGELPLAPGRGRLPERAEELGVGPQTAREIGWLAPAAP
jgi:hypothetical protein